MDIKFNNRINEITEGMFFFSRERHVLIAKVFGCRDLYREWLNDGTSIH